jgi:hypothetical protein
VAARERPSNRCVLADFVPGVFSLREKTLDGWLFEELQLETCWTSGPKPCGSIRKLCTRVTRPLCDIAGAKSQPFCWLYRHD